MIDGDDLDARVDPVCNAMDDATAGLEAMDALKVFREIMTNLSVRLTTLVKSVTWEDLEEAGMSEE